MSAVALVLAAGEGTRMKSELPKVAHRILGEPLVGYVVDAARAAGCERIIAITGHGADVVESLLDGVETVRQREQLGTGHAVMCASETLVDFRGSLLVLSGDTPLLRPETLAGLVAMRESSGAALTLLTTHLHDPSGYGRIVRNRDGGVDAIVEDKDLLSEQRSLNEINTGTYCFDAAVLFAHLDRLGTENAQGEYYLTDMVRLFNDEGLLVSALSTDEPLETLGVNSRVQLAEAGAVLQRRINTRHMLDGVTMMAPDLVWIGPGVILGRDIEILPMTFLTGRTTVGDRSILGPNSRIADSKIGEGASIDSSVVEEAVIGPNARIGPVAYIRPGTVLEAGATAGAFIGSDTMLVAPVRIDRGAVTGAGSATSRDVPVDSPGSEPAEWRTVQDPTRSGRTAAEKTSDHEELKRDDG